MLNNAEQIILLAQQLVEENYEGNTYNLDELIQQIEDILVELSKSKKVKYNVNLSKIFFETKNN